MMKIISIKINNYKNNNYSSKINKLCVYNHKKSFIVKIL